MMTRLVTVLSAILFTAACSEMSNTTPTTLTTLTAPATLGTSNLTAQTVRGGSCTLANGNTASPGFDQYGYNRCAHIFNGAWEGYCTEPKRNAPPDCYGVKRDTKLNMKWNEEWDRGNATGWSQGPYDAYLDNETKGYYVDGTPFSEHFKTRWDAGCVASSGTSSSNGGECIWGAFEVLMYQGKEDGFHFWWTKLTPAGYGN